MPTLFSAEIFKSSRASKVGSLARVLHGLRPATELEKVNEKLRLGILVMVNLDVFINSFMF